MSAVEDTLARLKAAPKVWVRLAAVRSGPTDGLRVKLLEIISGEAPPTWRKQRWDYPLAVLDSYETTGAALVEMISHQAITVGDASAATTELQHVSVDRKQSNADAFFEPLPWPVAETNLSLLDAQLHGQDPSGHLISDGDAPSFVSFYVACCSYFSMYPQSGGQLTSQAIYRHQDRRGRLKAVRVNNPADLLEIEVEGDSLAGLTVEWAGWLPGLTEQLSVVDVETYGSTIRVSFPLGGGLSPGSWVLLRRGSEWLDRRFFDNTYRGRRESGVEFVADQASRLEALVSVWERVDVEFKRHVPGDDDSKFKMMKTVCAFANGEGGSVLIGVDNDDRSLVGVDPRSVDRLELQIGQMVRSWIEPYPVIEFETLPIPDSDQVVLEVVVKPDTALHGTGRKGESRRPYVRHHSSTEVASVAEITQIVTQRSGGVPGPWNWLQQ